MIQTYGKTTQLLIVHPVKMIFSKLAIFSSVIYLASFEARFQQLFQSLSAVDFAKGHSETSKKYSPIQLRLVIFAI